MDTPKQSNETTLWTDGLDRVYVTQADSDGNAGIGICAAGRCVVLPAAQWIALKWELENAQQELLDTELINDLFGSDEDE